MSVQEVNRINIAIDGPAGAGKSTVARQVASRLEYVYVDTGAMYRAVTLHAQRNGVNANQAAELQQLVSNIHIELVPSDAGQIVRLEDEDVSTFIRSREVTSQVSYFAANEHVRIALSNMQRKLAQGKGIVMDGRDIGTHVLPDAELKIFLTASVEQRARRRHNELTAENYVSLEQLEAEIATRDRLDETREIAPLIQAKDATLVDSSHMSIDEVTEFIVQLGMKKLVEVLK